MIKDKFCFSLGIFNIGCLIASILLKRDTFVVAFCTFSAILNLMIGFFGG